MPIIQAVDRALRILDLFDEYETEIKITDISERMMLHKSTVHSLLKTLQMHHYIEQNPENGKYRLGLKLFERGNFVIQNLDIRSLAKQHLLEISKETGRTVHLVLLVGHEGVYIDKIESPTATILYSRIGGRVPIHSSGVGKALLISKSNDEIEEILKDYEFTKQTPNTISSKEEFLEEMDRVREKGYAIDNQENEPGVYCVAFPIRNHDGRVVAALSLSAAANQLTDAEIATNTELLRQKSCDLSAKLGYQYRASLPR
ncbi:IclR family transcriptional regulator [Bacillus sp. Marseille-P3661]|uniref:IclR family transcriptional regulator n=1 Tax=Bacillus sp. Marseille-P3661 TaxID=1936234 RepID=UPI000C8276D5|nr:IclR family transcriptional regulator [Bacillus sp. Marseille-P3661]